MKHTAKPYEQLWICSMGKKFRVRAMFTTDEESNAFMATHSETALIAEFGPFRIIANQYSGLRDEDAIPEPTA